MNQNISPAVTVAVPVFNTSKYLRQNLDSLERQTLKDIEIIIVDDGSTDESGIICEEYSRRNPNFKVIHQKNGGLASARQTGLEAATGEYIIVCDSDDWVEPDMYEQLYKAAKEVDADIVICNYYSEYDDGRNSQRQQSFKKNGRFVDSLDFMKKAAGASWIKLIRRSLFKNTNSTYEIGINQGEDALIIYKLLKGNPRILHLDHPLYHYRRVMGGDSYTNNTKMSSIFQLKFIYDWLKVNYPQDEYSQLLFVRSINLAFTCLRAKDLDKDFLKRFLKEEIPFNLLLSNRITLKSLCVLMEKLLPLSLVKRIFNIIYPLAYK